MTKQEEHDYIIQIRPPDLSTLKVWRPTLRRISMLQWSNLLTWSPHQRSGHVARNFELSESPSSNLLLVGLYRRWNPTQLHRDYVISHHLLRFLWTNQYFIKIPSGRRGVYEGLTKRRVHDQTPVGEIPIPNQYPPYKVYILYMGLTKMGTIPRVFSAFSLWVEQVSSST